MALVKTPYRKALILQVDKGFIDGKRVTKPKRYSLKNTNATAEKIYEVAIAIGSLMEEDVNMIFQSTEDALSDDGK